MKQKFRNRGLPSLEESRHSRRRQIVTGRAAVGGLPPKVFLWGLFILVIGGFLYFRSAQADLEDQRRALMATQRSTAKVLGPQVLPLRDQIEAGVLELAADAKDSISNETDWEELFSKPGVYLRLQLKDAGSKERIREVSIESLRDGFTSCLMHDPKADSPVGGKECRDSLECGAGSFCNQYDHCQRPSSPFNMRMIYRALSVLSDKWTQEIEDAGTDYALTGYRRSLDSITKVDIPMAFDIQQRAKYAVVVLDEEPKGGLPKQVGAVFESDAERIQRSAHHARSGKLLARVRAEAAGELKDVGTRAAPTTARSIAARARQANSCALALAFKSRVSPAEPAAPRARPLEKEELEESSPSAAQL